MFNKNQEQKLHLLFDISLIAKGLHAILEIIGGIVTFFLTPDFLTKVVLYFVQEDANDNSGGYISTHLLHFLQNYSVNTEHFIAIYLLSHGIVKAFLVYNLLKEEMWAFPTAIVVFSGFGIYQIYRYTHTHSIMLLVLTVVDLLVILLAWHEWKQKSDINLKKINL